MQGCTLDFETERNTSLTPRQRDVLNFLIEFRDREGFVPTVREVMARFGWTSPNSVCEHLWKLEQKGYIRSAPGKCRAIRILRAA